MNGGARKIPDCHAADSHTEVGVVKMSVKRGDAGGSERGLPPGWLFSKSDPEEIWDISSTGETPVVPVRFATVVVNPRANTSNATPVVDTRRRRTQTRTSRSRAAASRQRTAAEESAHTTTNDRTSRIVSTNITEPLPVAPLHRPCQACDHRQHQERDHLRSISATGTSTAGSLGAASLAALLATSRIFLGRDGDWIL